MRNLEEGSVESKVTETAARKAGLGMAETVAVVHEDQTVMEGK